MKFATIDTETTGLFNFKIPADAPGQPRMASLALITLAAIDAEPVRRNFFIRPDGWSMPAEASAINGLDDEFLHANGVPVAEALDAYVEAVEGGHIVVAFNAQFDTKVLRAELRRAGRDDMFDRTPNICVMRALEPYEARGLCMRNHAFVKLVDACRFFGITNDAAHSALGDADAAHEILLRLHADGLLPDAKVHYAKAGAAA
jgi:DNA polymerase III epsilon subunit-like protein